MSLEAANPNINATVTASAGSGKTYMLVTRIVRLLLEDAQPGSILALTFTRKAAAEMQQRLSERLYQLATVDDEKLFKLLNELDLGKEYQQKARALYEAHQYCDYPVRTLTFHSFCQDLLARFPLEADVPPNFDLLESADLLIQQARDALFNVATLDMQGELSKHLQQLMKLCGGLFNLDKVLNSFLQHRSDWWAYTDNEETNKASFASQRLATKLGYSSDTDPLTLFFNADLKHTLKEFAQLLVKAAGKKNLQSADDLANWLVDARTDSKSFNIIRSCFLTQKDEALSAGRKDTKALRKKLGDDAAEEFLDVHQHISQQIIDTLDQLNKQHCWQLNHHWFYCGEKLIEHYQTLKTQQRLLDFTDLEWRSYKLLQDSENALWIQYKLDQQIQHLLIDEFQDTNPTQWQLILPLLEEMAAAESEKHRSVFLVGDEKQSIYSFRRAKPELQQQAANWLEQNLNAQAFPLNKSWRSSPAIIETVNAVFSQDEYQKNLPGFIQHETHLKNLPGKVEVLPLWKMSDLDDKIEPVYCRNPLKEARAEAAGIHQKEARQIAQHIQQLIKNKTAITDDDSQRAVTYNDIYILVRKRAHVADYEQALRDAGIAYLGTNRGTFLSCLEIQDMEALLDTLLTPFNNLALAQVLKSPLFSASDDDLQILASHNFQGHWFEKLELLSNELDDQHPLKRAWHFLSIWRALADKIPVHDLLDKIFSQADVLERYKRSTPEALQARVQANLTLFLEMALDLDSGRYPSLMHFLFHLRSLRHTQSDAPDEAPMETREPRVRIMTIHASKGLEAPVVYLADTITGAKDRSSLSTLVDWPVEDKRPEHFQLVPSSKLQDSTTRELTKQSKEALQKEDANLLYVAITRARQYLFISGCQPDRGPFTNWYQPIFTALQTLTGNTEDEQLTYPFGTQLNCDDTETTSIEVDNIVDIDIALTKKIVSHEKPQTMLAPSRLERNAAYFNNDENFIGKNNAGSNTENSQSAKTRGIAIHRMLELLSQNQNLTSQNILQKIIFELHIEDEDELQDWLTIATSNYSHPELQSIFNPDNIIKVYDECPVQYSRDDRLVYGIIDRLIVEQNDVTIVDYKTHQHANKNNLHELSVPYQQQMSLYADGLKQLWPDRQIKSYLLFTECSELFEVDV
ncbi:MAG: DNA helicase UvrD [endosymbiont of Galathealinum brachiosum]|uniref:DNA 3'-5' helicase n=1 Tax=endosymbiont of Galathealinum brachiosum TaxID=2200906 RepID=A0A370DJ27_9GAMM|nr:MAG: DNA helicase UvrD [endosymbiont of Galathealinum brachiosum]